MISVCHDFYYFWFVLIFVVDTEDIDDVDDYDTPRAPVTNKRLSDRIEKSATHKDADRDLGRFTQLSS